MGSHKADGSMCVTTKSSTGSRPPSNGQMSIHKNHKRDYQKRWAVRKNTALTDRLDASQARGIAGHQRNVRSSQQARSPIPVKETVWLDDGDEYTLDHRDGDWVYVSDRNGPHKFHYTRLSRTKPVASRKDVYVPKSWAEERAHRERLQKEDVPRNGYR